jgi:predicted esterase
MMTQKNIIVPKTARYFILGEPSEQIEQIWFVCHGYGELAEYFIKKFEVLANEKTLIVAPEALNRFYRQGLTGRVGATWMTKVERESEIADYIHYLDLVYSEILASFKNEKMKINVLGFSQGTAAVCRWIAHKKSYIDNLVLWAGFFPHDLDYEANRELLNRLNTHIVVGEQDEFYSKEMVQEQLKIPVDKNIKHRFLYFKGKHEIHQETLLEVVKNI